MGRGPTTIKPVRPVMFVRLSSCSAQAASNPVGTASEKAGSLCGFAINGSGATCAGHLERRNVVKPGRRLRVMRWMEKAGTAATADRIVKQRDEIRNLRKKYKREVENLHALRDSRDDLKIKRDDLKIKLGTALFLLEIMTQHCGEIEERLAGLPPEALDSLG